jgi:hypothetical protein
MSSKTTTINKAELKEELASIKKDLLQILDRLKSISNG